MIRVGGTYSYGDTRFATAHFVFVVVDEGSKAGRPPVGEETSPGFVALILHGQHRSSPWDPFKGPGETFACAVSSAIAHDSVRFPAEE